MRDGAMDSPTTVARRRTGVRCSRSSSQAAEKLNQRIRFIRNWTREQPFAPVKITGANQVGLRGLLFGRQGAQFVGRQLAVLVQIQRVEAGGGIGDLGD